MSKYKKIGIVVIGVILLGIFFRIIFHPVLVLDSETGKPIANAEVNVEVSNWATGCGNPVYNKTNILGVTFFINPILFPCRISAWHQGYHVNGYNSISESKN